MKAQLSLSRLLIRHAGVLKHRLPAGLFFLFFMNIAAGQVIFSTPGMTYTNTDGRTFDAYGGVSVSGCTSVSFSVDYSFSLPWEGSGNMESCDDGCIGIVPCACDPNIIAVPNDGCHNCWDFLWVRFFINGVEVGGDLIGDAGTTDAEQTGTISTTFCTNGAPGNASIEVYTQTWGATESVTFSNITITCIDNTPTLPNLGPYCQSDAPVALPTSPGGVPGTWSGPGVTGGNTFNPALAGTGTWNLTFTANPSACAGSATTAVTVIPSATINLTPIGPFCQTGAPVPLPGTQSGVNGTWSGTGVSGGFFNPAAAGTGTFTLTFTPNPGQCAAPANLNVLVNAATTPTFGPIGPFCESGAPSALPTVSQNGISGNWSGAGVSGNQFNPAAVGSGSFSLLFTPNPGQCASSATVNVLVDALVLPMPTPIGPFCTGDPTVPLPTVVDGVSGNWAGSLVTNNIFNPGSAGNFTITFNPDPGQCAFSSSLMVQITPAATPALTPLGPFCSTDPPVSLPAVQDGITGSWVGNGVTGGNTFNPALTGGGAFQLTFIPAPGECANNNSISVMVNSPVASPPGQPLQVCYTLVPFSFTDNLPAIINAINNGTGQQVNWYLDPAGTNPLDPNDPADLQTLIAGGPNQTIYAAVFDGALGATEREALRRRADHVALPAAVADRMVELRDWLIAHDIAVSDRRWVKVAGLMRTAAASDGRDALSPWDLMLLPACLGSDGAEQQRVCDWLTTRLGVREASTPPRLERVVAAFEGQLLAERNADDLDYDEDGRLRMTDAQIAGEVNDMKGGSQALRMTYTRKRRYGDTHIGARTGQLDDLLARIGGYRDELAEVRHDFARYRDASLWLDRPLAVAIDANLATIATALDDFAVRARGCRAGFEALPRLPDDPGIAPEPVACEPLQE